MIERSQDDSAALPARNDSSDAEPDVYTRIRNDILGGALNAFERLKVRDLAERYAVSTNPVREALQQLRGEGLVVIVPNRGAHVRAIDEEFLRNISEIQAMLEPYMARWFVRHATHDDIEKLEQIQAEIEELNFTDTARNSKLDFQFHITIYGRHYNDQAIRSWKAHYDLLQVAMRKYPVSLGRQAAVMKEHRALIDAIKRQDADGVAATMTRHVDGSSQHMMEQVRSRVPA